jgi:hypothetical protein
MSTRVQPFHAGLVVGTIDWGTQEAEDDPAQTTHALDAADAITGLCAACIVHTSHRSRVDDGCLFTVQRVTHDLHPHRQDHGPAITRSTSGATAFLASGEEDRETGVMQSDHMILARFPDTFLREGDGTQRALREMWGWTRPLHGVLDTADPFVVSSPLGHMLGGTSVVSPVSCASCVCGFHTEAFSRSHSLLPTRTKRY